MDKTIENYKNVLQKLEDTKLFIVNNIDELKKQVDILDERITILKQKLTELEKWFYNWI